jgi:hypothetical protein
MIFGIKQLQLFGAIASAAFSLVLALGLPLAGSARAADARHPAVVELFTSQGCSSCPPANANFGALADRPDVLALSFGVTYWDQLGWKDIFAQPAFTARQYDYARGLGHSNVFTPQVVVNGRVDGDGIAPGAIEGLIHRGEREAGPETRFSGGEVTIGAGPAPARPATVWLVRYDPGVVMVPIARGENAGRTLPHRHVVRELVALGPWTGQARTWRLPPAGRPGLATAVLVQAGAGGAILAAGKA